MDNTNEQNKKTEDENVNQIIEEKKEEIKEEKKEEIIEEKKEEIIEEKKEEIKKEEINNDNSFNKLIEEINEKFKNLESIEDVRQQIINYNSIEKNIFTTKSFKETSYIEKIHNLFYNHFFNEKDLIILKKKCAYEKDVLNALFEFYFTQDIIGEIKKIFFKDEGKDFGIEKKEILKRTQTSVLNLGFNYVKKKFNSKQFQILLFILLNNYLNLKLKKF